VDLNLAGIVESRLTAALSRLSKHQLVTALMPPSIRALVSYTNHKDVIDFELIKRELCSLEELITCESS
jgi:hypothetical protein